MRLFFACTGAIVLTVGVFAAFQAPAPQSMEPEKQRTVRVKLRPQFGLPFPDRPRAESAADTSEPAMPSSPFGQIRQWGSRSAENETEKTFRQYLLSFPHREAVQKGEIARSFSADHDGVDYRTEAGQEVMATANGRVAQTGKHEDFGRFVRIGHGNGYSTFFAYLGRVNVREGEPVSAGDVVGTAASSDHVGASGLHYEVIRYNQSLNPELFTP